MTAMAGGGVINAVLCSGSQLPFANIEAFTSIGKFTVYFSESKELFSNRPA